LFFEGGGCWVMTRDELLLLLDGQELYQTVDVKTLVLDLVKRMPADDIQGLFWDKLPALTGEQLSHYFYMKRS
jgi:hypothetical protein